MLTDTDLDRLEAAANAIDGADRLELNVAPAKDLAVCRASHLRSLVAEVRRARSEGYSGRPPAVTFTWLGGAAACATGGFLLFDVAVWLEKSR